LLVVTWSLKISSIASTDVQVVERSKEVFVDLRTSKRPFGPKSTLKRPQISVHNPTKGLAPPVLEKRHSSAEESGGSKRKRADNGSEDDAPPKQCKGPLKEGPISVDHTTSPSPQPQPLIKKGKGKAKSKPKYSSKVIIGTSDEESDALALCRPAPKAKAPLVSTDLTKGESFLKDQHCDFCIKKNYSPCVFKRKSSVQMLAWAKNAHLGTQQPVKRWPNFTTCNACLTSHQSNCFLPQASKLLGVDFMHYKL